MKQNNHSGNWIFTKDGKIVIKGSNGKANILMSSIEFDLDQFDIRNIIESLFDTLTERQKENLSNQLTDRRNKNVE